MKFCCILLIIVHHSFTEDWSRKVATFTNVSFGVTLLCNKVRWLLDVMVMEILLSPRGIHVVWFINNEVNDPVKKIWHMHLCAMLEHSL